MHRYSSGGFILLLLCLAAAYFGAKLDEVLQLNLYEASHAMPGWVPAAAAVIFALAGISAKIMRMRGNAGFRGYQKWVAENLSGEDDKVQKPCLRTIRDIILILVMMGGGYLIFCMPMFDMLKIITGVAVGCFLLGMIVFAYQMLSSGRRPVKHPDLSDNKTGAVKQKTLDEYKKYIGVVKQMTLDEYEKYSGMMGNYHSHFLNPLAKITNISVIFLTVIFIIIVMLYIPLGRRINPCSLLTTDIGVLFTYTDIVLLMLIGPINMIMDWDKYDAKIDLEYKIASCLKKCISNFPADIPLNAVHVDYKLNKLKKSYDIKEASVSIDPEDKIPWLNRFSVRIKNIKMDSGTFDQSFFVSLVDVSDIQKREISDIIDKFNESHHQMFDIRSHEDAGTKTTDWCLSEISKPHAPDEKHDQKKSDHDEVISEFGVLVSNITGIMK